MDAVAGLVDGPRATNAFLLRAILDPPWSVRVEDEAPVCLVAMVAGEAWIVPDDAPALRVGPGAVAVLRGPDHYTVADDPATAPQVVIHPGQRCTSADGHDLAQAMDLGVRTWGTSPGGSTVMLVGIYERRAEISRPLVDALPPRLVVGAGQWDSPLLDVLGAEVANDEPGQETVLDRLLDLVLIGVLRTWLARPEAGAPAWYRSQRDPVVGRAVRMLQNNPAERWTVASLAAATGVSRAALARRFTDVVGEPPMAFLTAWRLKLGADLMREPGATVTSVAREVGYGSPFSFSAAFKRAYGVSPREHRAGARR